MFEESSDWESTEGRPGSSDWRAGFFDHADPPCSPANTDPSGWVALELDAATADVGKLEDPDLIDALVGLDRVSSWAAARQARLLAEFARRRPGDDPSAVTSDVAGSTSRYAPDEVGLALHLSRGSAMIRLGQSMQLAATLPATLALWERGQLDLPKVRAICDATQPLTPEQAREVEKRVLPRAPQQTLGQLRAALGRAVIAVDPRGANERHQQARRDRQVRLRDQPDGMGSLWALLAAPDAVAAYEWLTRLARALGATDPRTMDARRADLLVQLLTGALTITPAPDTTTPEDTGPNDATADSGAAAGGDSESAAAAAAVDDGDTAAAAADDGVAQPVAADVPADRGAGADIGGADPATEPSTGTAGDSTGAGDRAPPDTAAAKGRARPTAGTAGAPPTTTPTCTCRTGAGRQVERRTPAAPGKPLVHVVMPFTTLLGVDDLPCELSGYGPIPADLARQIAADAVWKRLITDPESGALLDHGRTTYRPPDALADHVRARDQQCRMPICRRRVDACELDHTIAWDDGGTTADHNLNGGCVHHHHCKHDEGWTVTQTRDGRMEWTTPTGHTYTSDPYDYRPDPDPDPPTPTEASRTGERVEGTGRAERLTPSIDRWIDHRPDQAEGGPDDDPAPF